MNWICSQVGAREHYAIPRALHQARRLDSLYTDFWAPAALRSLRWDKLRSLAARYRPDLADARVTSFNLRAMCWEMAQRKRHDLTQKYEGYIEIGHAFAKRVARSLRYKKNFIFFGYDTASLETMQELAALGIPCLLGQIDPSRVEARLVLDEEQRWPGWAASSTTIPESYFERRAEEWNLATRIVVNSAYVRQALIDQGVPPAKLEVIPLCYEPEGPPASPRSWDPVQGPLKVLFLGQVILRKGIPYLLEAARLLRDYPVHVDIVGPIGLTQKALAIAPPNVTFHGRVSRDQVRAWYERSHLFVLPTLSDGFAVTQIEAMAYALPVIATDACGEVVTSGQDGVIVPPRDPEKLAQAIVAYIENPPLLAAHGRAALLKARQFGMDQLAARLLKLETDL